VQVTKWYANRVAVAPIFAVMKESAGMDLGAYTPWHARMGNNSLGDTERVHIGGDEDET